MSTPVEELVLSDPVRWCRMYQQLGLLVHVDYDHQRIIRPVNDFAGAVTMPGELGEKVRAKLEAADLPLAIVGHPRSKSWTFLTSTHAGRYDDIDLFARLFLRNVRVTPRGGCIALPSPIDGEMHWREWIVGPSGDLPPMDLVVAATLAAVKL